MATDPDTKMLDATYPTLWERGYADLAPLPR